MAEPRDLSPSECDARQRWQNRTGAVRQAFRSQPHIKPASTQYPPGRHGALLPRPSVRRGDLLDVPSAASNLMTQSTGGGALGFGRGIPPPPPTGCWPEAPWGGGVVGRGNWGVEGPGGDLRSRPQPPVTQSWRPGRVGVLTWASLSRAQLGMLWPDRQDQDHPGHVFPRAVFPGLSIVCPKCRSTEAMSLLLVACCSAYHRSRLMNVVFAVGGLCLPTAVCCSFCPWDIRNGNRAHALCFAASGDRAKDSVEDWGDSEHRHVQQIAGAREQ